MRQAIFLFIVVLSYTNHISAQNFVKSSAYEIGLSAGLANYAGDLAGTPFAFNEFRFAYSVFFETHLSRRFSFRTQFFDTFLTGDDRNIQKTAFRKFKFTTSLTEFSLMASYQAFDFSNIFKQNLVLSNTTLYVIGGGGIAFVKPKAECYGTREECEKNAVLGFPEPGLPSRLPVAIAGVGLRYFDDMRAVWRAEFGMRTTFSDLLDGIDKNAASKSSDYYFFIGFSVGFLLNNTSVLPKR